LITGSVGCGKTFAMHAIIKAFTIECFDAEQLSKLTMDQQEHQVHDYLRFNNDMFLDDIGSEDVVSSYGNKQNIVADFLINWHTHMVKIPVDRRASMFITTNLSIDQLIAKYGLRVLDRVAEICDLIEMSGKSQRRAWKKYGG
jgi:DNA replication protein DnaC